MDDIKVIDDWLDTAQLVCTKTDGKTKYDFNNFTFPLKFASKNQTKKNEKDDALKFAREEIISAFKKGIFLYIDGFQVEKETDEESALENEEIDTTDMPDLENEESAAQGKGLKILTPNQMLGRLPITLAQLNAGNNSEKLKNEIRQLLYSLYR